MRWSPWLPTIIDRPPGLVVTQWGLAMWLEARCGRPRAGTALLFSLVGGLPECMAVGGLPGLPCGIRKGVCGGIGEASRGSQEQIPVALLLYPE